MLPGLWRRRELLRTGLGALAAAAMIPRELQPSEPPRATTPPYRVLADGLQFPEGPVAMPDGSVLVVEIARGTLTRVHPDDTTEVVAELGGGPNGAAIGPDGACFVCNNGGASFTEIDGVLLPVGPARGYAGGWIERVDPGSGRSEVLYRKVGKRQLSAPNDLVFDQHGGFWFTDLGKSGELGRDHGAIGYALADGSAISDVVYPFEAPNGIVLSPDEQTLFVAELYSGRLIAFDIQAPGQLAASDGFLPGRFVAAGPGRHLFDSMAVEADGTICVAAPLPGDILRFTPDGRLIETIAMPGPLPTNLCFGGPDMRTAFVTLAGNGQLIAMEWPQAGLPLLAQ